MKNKYKYTSNQNYEDYSSGRVIYGNPGATNFPVRLSSEIFQHCICYLRNKGIMGPYRIYDPFCGVAYSCTILGFLHRNDIISITASDTNQDVLKFANKNLLLLTPEGLIRRIEELNNLIKNYNKDSHKQALESAYRLQLKTHLSPLEIRCFQQNAIIEENLLLQEKYEIVITDLPYGRLTQWDVPVSAENFSQCFLDSLKNKLSATAICALIFEKKQSISFHGYKVIKNFIFSNRRVVLLQLDDGLL
ncbi:MAG: hypothetical protein H0X29_05615 [Parachlamydiaceae bacterium]|nr:hypothetical protein [Parachlamydiaceae bacterium]